MLDEDGDGGPIDGCAEISSSVMAVCCDGNGTVIKYKGGCNANDSRCHC